MCKIVGEPEVTDLGIDDESARLRTAMNGPADGRGTVETPMVTAFD